MKNECCCDKHSCCEHTAQGGERRFLFSSQSADACEGSCEASASLICDKLSLEPLRTKRLRPGCAEAAECCESAAATATVDDAAAVWTAAGLGSGAVGVQGSFRRSRRPRGSSCELLAGAAVELPGLGVSGSSSVQLCSALQEAERSLALALRSSSMRVCRRSAADRVRGPSDGCLPGASAAETSCPCVKRNPSGLVGRCGFVAPLAALGRLAKTAA